MNEEGPFVVVGRTAVWAQADGRPQLYETREAAYADMCSVFTSEYCKRLRITPYVQYAIEKGL